MLTGWWVRKAEARAFARATGGNVAMMWALMGVILVGLVGVSVDFTRAQMLRAQMQNAADGAALVAERSSSLSSDARRAAAQAFFNAEMGDQATLTTFNVTDLTDGGHQVNASIPMPLSLGRVITNHDWHIAVQASAEADASPPIEVAMVLDNTGSMSNDMAGLRSAAHDLSNFLLSLDGDSVKVALVPFVAMVNVGNSDTSFIDTTGLAPFNGELFEDRQIAWRQINNCASTAAPSTTFAGSPYAIVWGACTVRSGQQGRYAYNPATISNYTLFQQIGGNGAWKGCVEARPEPYDITDEPPNASIPATLFVPAFWLDAAGNSSNSSSSNSYITDSAGLPTSSSYVTTVVSGTTYNTGAELSVWKYRSGVANTITAPATYPDDRGPNRGCPTPIVPLTSDVSTISAGIDAMQYHNGGGTNQVEGLAWGWRVLSPGAPFTQGRPYNDTSNPVHKILVMMTDGENTNINGTNDSVMQSDYSAYSHLGQWTNSANPPGYRGALPSGYNRNSVTSSSSMVSYIDNREATICTSIKAVGIEIYTIQFRDNTTANANRLRDCASAPDHFYQAANASQLQSAFHAIGSGIGQLRITH